MTGANSFHLAVDVEEAFPKIGQMTFCHQSQISNGFRGGPSPDSKTRVFRRLDSDFAPAVRPPE